MRIKTVAAVAAIFGAIAFAGPGLAAPGADPNPNNGNDNGYHHDGQTAPNAQCGTGAGSGAFGAFSHGYVPTTYPDPHDRAADGQATGISNSSLCGNRANAPGQLP